MTKKLQVVAIGAGYFSEFHFAAWQRLADTTLGAIVELDASKRIDLRARFPDTLIVESLSQALEQIDADIIDIITPPSTHEAQIDTAIRLTNSAIIICQKPFCGTLEKATAVAERIDQSGRTVIVHENFRFQPWYAEIKTLIDNGSLGQVLQADFRLRPGDGHGPHAYLDRQPYFRDMPRFLIHETGIHWVDVFRYLFGDPQAVSADLRTLNKAIKGEDAGFFAFHYDNGLRAHFDGNRLLDHDAENTRLTLGDMLVEGTEGSLTLSGDGQITLRQFGSRKVLQHHYDFNNVGFGGDCVYRLQQHVVQHALEGAILHNQAVDYIRNLQLEELIYQAAALQKTQTYTQ